MKRFTGWWASRQSLVQNLFWVRKPLGSAMPDSITRSIEFAAAEADHGPLALDLHRSAIGGPVVLYVHGGGFARGARDDNEARLQALASHGITVATIDYRLSPAATYPDPIDDVHRAVRFLRAHAAELDIEANRIGAIGASAGGYLTSMAALTPPDAESSIDAVSAWYAPTDLWTSTRRSPLEDFLSPATFEANLLGSVDDPAHLRATSPSLQDLTDAPPFLFVHGDRDRWVLPQQSDFFHEALQRCGRSSTFLRVGGAGHEDPAFDSGPVPAMVGAWFVAMLHQ